MSTINADQLDLVVTDFEATGTDNRQLGLLDGAVTAGKLGFAWETEIVDSSSFSFDGTRSSYSLASTPNTNANVAEFISCLTNGVDDLELVTAPTAAAGEFAVSGSTLTIHGDVTYESRTYKIRYITGTALGGGGGVTHAPSHLSGAADAIDGDRLDISYTPTNYTQDVTPGEVTLTSELTAHLAGIDNVLATAGGVDGTGTANRLMLWLDSDTATNSSFQESSTHLLAVTGSSQDLGTNGTRWRSLYLSSTINTSSSLTLNTGASADVVVQQSGSTWLTLDSSANAIVFNNAGDIQTSSTLDLTATQVNIGAPTTFQRLNITETGATRNLVVAESGAVCDNIGSGTAINNFNLPSAAAGLQFTFIDLDDSNTIRATAGSGDFIRVAGSTSTSGGTVTSSNKGDSLTLVCVDDGTEGWVAISEIGIWTLA